MIIYQKYTLKDGTKVKTVAEVKGMEGECSGCLLSSHSCCNLAIADKDILNLVEGCGCGAYHCKPFIIIKDTDQPEESDLELEEDHRVC